MQNQTMPSVEKSQLIQRAINGANLINFYYSGKGATDKSLLTVFPFMLHYQDNTNVLYLWGIKRIDGEYNIRRYKIDDMHSLSILNENDPAWEIGWSDLVDYSNEMPILSTERAISFYDWSNWGVSDTVTNFEGYSKAVVAQLKTSNKKFLWLPDVNIQYWEINGKILKTNYSINKAAVKVMDVLDLKRPVVIGEIVKFPSSFSDSRSFIITNINTENKQTPVKAISVNNNEVYEIDLPFNVVT